MRIDAHQHFWAIADRQGQWPPATLAAIHRDFAPADLAPHLATAGIDGTLVVQSLPSLADTHWLLNLAERTPFIRGVVGWAALKEADAPAIIAELATSRHLKGLRPMLQDLPDPGWIDDPALDPAIDAMQAAGLVFDALVLPHHLPALARFAARHAALPIVIDHCAKPDIAGGDTAAWLRDMRVLAAMPQVHCKLSGLVTEAGTPPDMRGVAGIADTVLALFGAERMMFGSDWPVLNLAGTYTGWAQLVQERVVEILGAAAVPDIFGGTAQRFYRL